MWLDQHLWISAIVGTSIDTLSMLTQDGDTASHGEWGVQHVSTQVALINMLGYQPAEKVVTSWETWWFDSCYSLLFFFSQGFNQRQASIFAAWCILYIYTITHAYTHTHTPQDRTHMTHNLIFPPLTLLVQWFSCPLTIQYGCWADASTRAASASLC